jgi:type IV pilus assembly protein PilO
MNWQWSDLQELDLNNIGSAPGPVKIALIILACVVLLGAGWWFDLQHQQLTLQEVQKKEPELKQNFELKQKKAANLEALKQQLQEIKASAGEMLRRLPSKTEVAALLVDISQQGLGAGLEFELFKPGAEQPADFYVELPIQIRVAGSYHQFGQFVSGVADLPRIVTQHDIKIHRQEKGQGKDQGLVMEMRAKTYRYMDEEEAAAKSMAKPKGGSSNK